MCVRIIRSGEFTCRKRIWRATAWRKKIWDEDSRGTLWLLVHTYSALLARIESVDFAVFGERVRLSKPEKIMLMAKARFGRHTEENILAKCDRDRRRAGGA